MIGLQDNWMDLEGQEEAITLSVLVCGCTCYITNIHVNFSGEEFATGWVHQQDSLQEIQRRNYQEIILPITPFAHQTLQAGDQSHCHIPLK